MQNSAQHFKEIFNLAPFLQEHVQQKGVQSVRSYNEFTRQLVYSSKP